MAEGAVVWGEWLEVIIRKAWLMVGVGVWAVSLGVVQSFRKPARLSPVLVEAAASIIHAAPSTESKGGYHSLCSIRERVVAVSF